MLSIIVILVLCADMYLTWCLLAYYRQKVREANALARWFFQSRFLGNLIFVGARIALAAVIIQFTTWAGMAAFALVTGYAVVNNLLLWRKLKRG